MTSCYVVVNLRRLCSFEARRRGGGSNWLRARPTDRGDVTLRARARFTDVMADAAFDLQGCSTVELRDQVARARATFRRLKGELDARTEKAPYPSRLPPSLVLEFLPFRDLAAALRVSTAWRDQAEETFRRIAARCGLMMSEPWRLMTEPWREVVRSHVSEFWVEARDNQFRSRDGDPCGDLMMHHDFLSREFEHPGNYGAFQFDEIDCFVIGRSTMLEGEGKCFDFEVSISSSRSPEYVDACGVALTTGDDSETVHRICIWNSDGGTYDWAGPEQTNCTRFPVPGPTHELFGAIAQLRVAVLHHGDYLAFRLSSFNLGWKELHYDKWKPATLPQRLHVAPLVRIYRDGEDAAVTLLRLPPAARSFPLAPAFPTQ